MSSLCMTLIDEYSFFVFFFFSSRRRHTRCSRDWSSDVCSSDLASWDLDVFGGIRHTVQARGALADVAQEDLRDVQVSLTAEVARAYFELRGAQEQLLVAQRNAENQRAPRLNGMADEIGRAHVCT